MVKPNNTCQPDSLFRSFFVLVSTLAQTPPHKLQLHLALYGTTCSIFLFFGFGILFKSFALVSFVLW